MAFNREIQRLLAGALICFAIIAISAAYWAVIGRESLLNREDNPRLVEAEAAIRRGSIYDRKGNLLVDTAIQENNTLVRRYHYDATSSALGYFSLRYGVGGAEAAFDPLLRGDNQTDDLTSIFDQEMLHHPQIGSDIRLTYDLDVQQQLIAAMEGQTGAAVVMAVPDGQILALVSLPDYDPNTLDENWDNLIEAPGNPFFNRPLQGRYQPGGMLQTPLLTAALLNNRSLDTVYGNGTESVQLDGLTIHCAVEPPKTDITLAEAYMYACPAPFVELAGWLGETAMQNNLNTFRLETPPMLEDYVVEPDEGTADAETTPDITTEPMYSLTEIALGQGPLTISPLGMTTVTAAIVNAGNAPQPYTLLSFRTPGTTEWQPNPDSHATTPLMTVASARHLRDLMITNIEQGALQFAGQPGLTVGGHAALAFSGEETTSWFTGFVMVNETEFITVTIVLENNRDIQTAAQIGVTALKAAAESSP